MELQEGVELMIQINLILNSHIFNEDYVQIKRLVHNYLLKYCNHKKVKDLIDIDPDRSKEIEYCEKCMITF